MSDRAAIIPDMPIFGSDGALVGTVHRVSGVRIVVDHVGAAESHQHVIPLARVASVTDRVTLDCPAADAGPERMSAGKRTSVAPLMWLGVGVLGVALLYGAASLILRGSSTAAAPKPVVTPGVVTAPTTAAAPARTAVPATAAGPPQASRATITAYLASQDPAPRTFAVDTGFAPGVAALDAGGQTAVRGIAGVMTDHLNTQIKLAASGGLGLRRADTIKRGLVGLGVADYRVTTGAARGRARGKTGVELIVLAK